MITIYHNPKCSKSRMGLQFLENLDKEYKIRNYTLDSFSRYEIVALLKKMNIKPIDWVRTNEEVWKTNYKNKNLNDDEIIDALYNHQNLIQRPILEYKNFATIARTDEDLATFIKLIE